MNHLSRYVAHVIPVKHWLHPLAHKLFMITYPCQCLSEKPLRFIRTVRLLCSIEVKQKPFSQWTNQQGNGQTQRSKVCQKCRCHYWLGREMFTDFRLRKLLLFLLETNSLMNHRLFTKYCRVITTRRLRWARSLCPKLLCLRNPFGFGNYKVQE